MPTVKFPKSAVNPIGYVQITPDNIDKTKKYPLVIFLGGNGSLGDGSDASLQSLAFGAPVPGKPGEFYPPELPQALQDKAKQYQFIILCPQSAWGYDKATNHVGKMFEVAAFLPVDLTKVYLSGLSRGGEGVWGYPSQSAENAKRLASVVPVCAVPGRDMGSVCNIGLTSVWAFHASDDGTVSAQDTVNAVDRINACIGIKEKAKATIFPDGDHFIWGKVYSDENLYSWMLSKSTSEAAVVPPTKPIEPEKPFSVKAPEDFTTTSPVVKLKAEVTGEWDYEKARWSIIDRPESVNKYAPIVTAGGGWIECQGLLPKPGKYVFEIRVERKGDGKEAKDSVTVTYQNAVKPAVFMEFDLDGKHIIIYVDKTREVV